MHHLHLPPSGILAERARTRLSRTLVLLTALLAALLSLPLQPVRAAAEPEPVKLLFEVLRLKFDLTPRARVIRPRDDGYMLEDVTFARVMLDDEVRLSIRARRILLQGTASHDGLMLYRHIQVQDMEVVTTAEARVRIFIPRVEFAEASILPEDRARNDVEKLSAGSLLAATTSIPEIRFEIPGVEPFFWRGIHAAWEGSRRTGAGVWRVEYGTLKVPLLAMLEILKNHEDESIRDLEEFVRRLGLKDFIMTGYAENTTRWLPDNRMEMSGLQLLRFERIGELGISIDALALPLELLRELRDAGRRGMDAGDSAGASALDPAQQQRLLAAMQRLTIKGLEVRWRDLGLTPVVLESIARRQGLGTEAYLRRLEAELSGYLSGIPLPQVARRAMTAFMTFLREPGSFRIAIRGRNGQPIGVAGVVSLLLLSPQMLENTVDIIIEANR